ncbi:MAG: response regulator, partial [Oscillospiraceae bacterium]
MLKVLLVDDDDFVRTGLKNTVNWGDLGFEIVSEAKNGCEALEILEKIHVDLVITDICMPIMDGLMLVSKIKERELDIEVIILTGYDEFDYAKKAINNGVTLYLLKPVNTEELMESLLKIHIKIEKNNESNMAIENYKASLPLLKQRFLMNLVSENMSDEDIEKNLIMFEIASVDMTFYVVDILLKDSENSKEISEILENKLILDFGDKYHLFRLFEREFCAIIFLSDFQHIGAIKNCFKKILKSIQNEYGKVVSIGIGMPHTGYKNIKEAYTEAVKATEYRTIMGWGSVLYLEDLQKKSKAAMVYSDEDIDDVIIPFKNGEYHKAKAILRGKYIEFIESGIINIDYIRKFSLNVIFEINVKVLKPNMELDEIFGADFLPNKELHELDTIENMRDFMDGLVTKIADYLTEHGKNKYKKEVATAIEIIEKGYKSELSVENIAS